MLPVIGSGTVSGPHLTHHPRVAHDAHQESTFPPVNEQDAEEAGSEGQNVNKKQWLPILAVLAVVIGTFAMITRCGEPVPDAADNSSRPDRPGTGARNPLSTKSVSAETKPDSGNSGAHSATTQPRAEYDQIVFAVRTIGGDGLHWYANFGYWATNPKSKMSGRSGYLCKLNVKTAEVTKLIRDPDGAVRDPKVFYDGTKILFSWRKGGSDYYHLYEIGVDGKNLKQLTKGPYNDIEACYLPDGGIVFVSTRANRWVNCMLTEVATIYRCDADGSAIRQLSANIEQDNTPWVLPDGRILYTRWEYVDRSQVSYHHLWTMKPDGTEQMVYYGNLHPGAVYIDAKPIPGTNKVIMVNSGAHGAPGHSGVITSVHVDNGPDDRSAQTFISRSGGGYRDPYPLSPDSFLVAKGASLYSMNGDGKMTLVYKLAGELAKDAKAMLHEPRPIRPQRRETVIPSRVNLRESTGRLVLMDAYIGRNMRGVKRGDIKKLLVLETLPKPINYSGGMQPLSYGGTFTMNRVLGAIPVESDGSAYMELPANRSLFFVALDDNDLSVKRMQSFLSVMPGEVTTCIGCHEDRTMAAPIRPTLKALQRPASKIKRIPGAPEVFDYPRDIQPIWNKHCLKNCHDAGKRAGGLVLTGDNGPVYTHSYFELQKRLQMAQGQNNVRSNLSPRNIGSSASPLMNKIDKSHHGVTLDAKDRRLVKLWIDASAHFLGTYAGLGSGMIGNHMGRPDLAWPSTKAAAKAQKRRCGKCHTGKKKLPASVSDELALAPWWVGYAGGNGDISPLPWLVGVDNVRSTPPFSGWRAVDGVTTDRYQTEWVSKGQQNPWIQLHWKKAQTVNRVIIYDRPNMADHGAGGLLTFSDGSKVLVTGIPNDGSGKKVAFSKRSVTWMKFQVQGGVGPNVGLAELQVFGPSSGDEQVDYPSELRVSSQLHGNGDVDIGVNYAKNVGSNTWMKKYADPRLQFSRHVVYNLTRPKQSVLLMAPLAKSAGGYAVCGNVFANTSDPDYQTILAAIRDAKKHLDKITRFNMPNFRPGPHYIREMKRYGVLPASYKIGDPIDVYKTDQKYWESLWWTPIPDAP